MRASRSGASIWSWQLALAPDGRPWPARRASTFLADGSMSPHRSRTVGKVFNTLSGELAATFAHTPPVLSCAFSRDGKHLGAANLMGEVRIWNFSGVRAKPEAQWTSPDFTSWGTIKTPSLLRRIYGLAFLARWRVSARLRHGSMTDPMAGNGKMTWQRWNWRNGERIDQIKEGQHGSGSWKPWPGT